MVNSNLAQTYWKRAPKTKISKVYKQEKGKKLSEKTEQFMGSYFDVESTDFVFKEVLYSSFVPKLLEMEAEAFDIYPIIAILNNYETEWKLSPDKYIFIDLHVHKYGVSIKGEYRGPMIDFPTYNFNNVKKTLSGKINFKVNKKLKIVIGRGTSLSGNAGSGRATRLEGIYNLPYKDNNLEIFDVDIDGTVQLIYQGEPITLKSRDVWSNSTAEIDEQEFRGKKASAKIITTYRIRNYGILEKSKIFKKN